MHNVENNIVFYDGSCLLCSRTVRLLIRLDRKKQLRFSLVHGEYIKKLAQQIPTEAGDSILFWDGKTMHHSSDAVIAILETIHIPKLYIWLIRIFPRSFRNGMYRFIAYNRYIWFGKNAACFIPGVESKRFLD